MANRILRDWTDSEKVHQLSAEAERFFTRLIMKADDFGRYVGNIKLLRANLFPLHNKISDAKISKWLKECIECGLLLNYEVDGKSYLEIYGFDQKGLKVRRPKYPPSSEADRYELITGYVYLVGESKESPIKIGFSMNPWARLKEIGTNHPSELQLLVSFKAEKRTESLLHLAMKNSRVKNEWFKLTHDEFRLFESVASGELSTEELLNKLRSNYDNTTNTYESTTLPETEVESETNPNQKSNPKSEVTLSDFEKAFDELWFETIAMMPVHKGKDIKGAIQKAYLHMKAEGRLERGEPSDFKKCVQSFLNNERPVNGRPKREPSFKLSEIK